MAPEVGTVPCVEVRKVSKTFPNGTVALSDVSLAVRRGTVHGLMGANGAGKSTLLKILSGAHTPSGGWLLVNGQEVALSSPVVANRAGIATIHQHIPLVPTLTVIENIFLGADGIGRLPLGALDRFQTLCGHIGYETDPFAIVGSLSIGVRQMVAIMQALMVGADIVLMDEPTASLNENEREIVFRTVRTLATGGTTFIYVSHYIEEVLSLCTFVSVLRDGRVVLDCAAADTDAEGVIEAMTGRRIDRGSARNAATIRDGAPRLEITGVSTAAGVRDLSLNIHAGEVVGLAGLLGSGRSEILSALYGADRRVAGTVRVDGRLVGRGTGAAVSAGFGLVPEDRWAQGLVRQLPIFGNVTLPKISRHSFWSIWPQRESEVTATEEVIGAIGIVSKGPHGLVTELSGGNAQKVLLARWLAARPEILLLDEPTVGVDAAAKADILALVRTFAKQGTAVIMVSSEFEELLHVAERILVVRDKAIVATRVTTETTVEELMLLADRPEKEARAA